MMEFIVSEANERGVVDDTRWGLRRLTVACFTHSHTRTLAHSRKLVHTRKLAHTHPRTLAHSHPRTLALMSQLQVSAPPLLLIGMEGFWGM